MIFRVSTHRHSSKNPSSVLYNSRLTEVTFRSSIGVTPLIALITSIVRQSLISAVLVPDFMENGRDKMKHATRYDQLRFYTFYGLFDRYRTSESLRSQNAVIEECGITHVLKIANMNVPSGSLHSVLFRFLGSLRIADVKQKRWVSLLIDPSVHNIKIPHQPIINNPKTSRSPHDIIQETKTKNQKP